jgi:hypothetical protein
VNDRWTNSGTSEENIFDFCDKKGDIFFVSDWCFHGEALQEARGLLHTSVKTQKSSILRILPVDARLKTALISDARESILSPSYLERYPVVRGYLDMPEQRAA